MMHLHRYIQKIVLDSKISHYHLKTLYSTRGADSPIWLQRQMNDPYVKRARIESYRCRSAFKLLEIDSKYNLIHLSEMNMKRGFHALDLGAAPGSWSQVILRRLKLLEETLSKDSMADSPALKRHFVVSIDLNDWGSLPGAHCLSRVDIRNVERTLSLVRDCHSKHYSSADVPVPPCHFDLIVSDMAPNASGHKEIDMIAIVDLANAALKIGLHLLQPNGTFVCKLWAGNEQHAFESLLKKFFKTANTVKPSSSRSDSSEIFYLARELRLE